MRQVLVSLGILVTSFAAVNACGEVPAGHLLWELGLPDNDNAEFALAPSGHRHYTRDGFFVVGRSETKQDWPYVHPGPADRAFGGKPHTFTILFGVKRAGAEGDCRLLVDLINTHFKKPPELEVAVNGASFRRKMPAGAGDAAFHGKPAKGKEHRFDVVFPAALLKPGRNEIKITILSGSMVLYDWIALETPATLEGVTLGATFLERCYVTPHLLVSRNDALFHPAIAELKHFGAPAKLTIRGDAGEILKQKVDRNTTEIEFLLPACEREAQVPVTFSTPSGTVAEERIALTPARKLEIYLLPHSHVDIGYTKLQTKVEQDHWSFLRQAVEVARLAGTRPPEAQFKWNAEVLWAVDGYLRQASPEERSAFVDTVKRGQIGLDAFYCHELAGLCRPEELVRTLEYARRLSKELGISIESAMVTDCPGLTWGAIPVLAQSGVKYLSLGPNSGHRIGYTREAWDNRPFWWRSPCGQHRVLCWQTDNAYHPTFTNETELRSFLSSFDERGAGFPYDILYYRHCKGDNRGPDLAFSDFVENWNARFAYPRLVIATTTEAFRAFEKRYGHELPTAKGDFSPYWEDGAASSARETALNRASAERLVQAETLWAMRNPGPFPTEDFDAAWRNVILYDEHTWGARSYVRSGSSYPPGSPEYDAQWAIKQAFALDADAQSRALLGKALRPNGPPTASTRAVDVFNTSSWARTDLLVVPRAWRIPGEIIQDDAGNQLPVQRLASGDLAILVKNVPAFGAKRLTFHEGKPKLKGNARAGDTTLSNGSINVAIDKDTGAISSLRWKALEAELVDPQSAGLNSYHYVPGFDPEDALPNGPVSISVKESGPLVATIVIASGAPGCKALTREIRLVDGLDRVDITNRLDKKAIPLRDLLKRLPQKEGYHLGFAFDIPQGVMRIDTPWAVVRPETDQLPGACKNWFSAQRWVDISNEKFGATWASVDAPLVEVGAMSPQPRDPFAKRIWRKTIEASATLYSYVMNNYWTTNYRHDQPGTVVFRYSIAPHLRYDAAAAARFGIERSQALLIAPASKATPQPPPFLEVTPAGTVVTALKPIAGNEAWLVRLFGASGQAERVTLRWADGASARLWRSDLDGAPIEPVRGPIEILPFEMVTLRIEHAIPSPPSARLDSQP